MLIATFYLLYIYINLPPSFLQGSNIYKIEQNYPQTIYPFRCACMERE